MYVKSGLSVCVAVEADVDMDVDADADGEGDAMEGVEEEWILERK